MPESDFSSVVPAQLSFLAVYNPLLGPTDETIHEQVVFYTSRSNRLRQQDSSGGSDEKDSNNERNERLRQIGLAQGMVSFARNFSGGKAVDYVETEKSQIVVHELEEDWWILASVDLTRLPTDTGNGSSSQRDASDTPSFYYSSREMSPPQLLIRQLCQAHSMFLLHHASSLQDLYGRVGRAAFCVLLENFWLKFAWNWDVLLSGNPAIDMYNGIKLSAGGELGVGVGEEDWGSGEREVLEDFVSRTEGLVDLVVSRFGDPYTATENPESLAKPEGPQETENQWLGSDNHPRPSDGVIFSGVGTIERQSLVHVSQWMEWIYRYGAEAYGVGEDPTSPRRRKRRKRRDKTFEKIKSNQLSPPDGSQEAVMPERPFSPGIPKPLVMGAIKPPPSSKVPDGKSDSRTSGETSPAVSDKGTDWVGLGTETFVKYITLGYGSSWGFSSGPPSPHPRVEALKREEGPSEVGSLTRSPLEASDQRSSKSNGQPRYKSQGRFIIGLHDGAASSDTILEEIEATNSAEGSNEKIVKRTMHVRLTDPPNQDAADSSPSSSQLRVVVYMHQPFIYTFLFDPNTSSLEDPSLYHSIHHQLGPLQKSLNTSTSPATAAARISNPSDTDIDPEPHRQHRLPKTQQQQPQQQQQAVYDLVYDPTNLSIRSSIPNIPELSPSKPPEPTSATPWSRVESINIHHRLLTTYIETRSRPLELERTCKTSRGWWIVWVRFSSPEDGERETPIHDSGSGSDGPPGIGAQQQEAFLVRKASDHVSSSSGHGRNSSTGGSVGVGGGSGSRFFRDLGGASSPGLQAARIDTRPGTLVEGLGLDARRYIENLLSLNR